MEKQAASSLRTKPDTNLRRELPGLEQQTRQMDLRVLGEGLEEQSENFPYRGRV